MSYTYIYSLQGGQSDTTSAVPTLVSGTLTRRWHRGAGEHLGGLQVFPFQHLGLIHIWKSRTGAEGEEYTGIWGSGATENRARGPGTAGQARMPTPALHRNPRPRSRGPGRQAHGARWALPAPARSQHVCPGRHPQPALLPASAEQQAAHLRASGASQPGAITLRHPVW